MQAEKITRERLIGTWRLVNAIAVDANGIALPPPYGPSPMGRLVLTQDGRMMAVLCDGRSTIPAGEKRPYASYCGNFRVEDNALITIVDAAALTERIGSQQVRQLEIHGKQLVLIPPRRSDGIQRKLFWELDGPP